MAIPSKVKTYLLACINPEYRQCFTVTRGSYELLTTANSFWCKVLARHYLVRVVCCASGINVVIQGDEASCSAVQTVIRDAGEALLCRTYVESSFTSSESVDLKGLSVIDSLSDFCKRQSIGAKTFLLCWLEWHRCDVARYVSDGKSQLELRLTFDPEPHRQQPTFYDSRTPQTPDSLHSLYPEYPDIDSVLSAAPEPSVHCENIPPQVEANGCCASGVPCAKNNGEGNGVVDASNSASRLRPIIIDGKNVAMMYGRYEDFQPFGILVCARYFLERGHDVLTFVPFGVTCRNSKVPQDLKNILFWMFDQKLLLFTPSRSILSSGERKKIPRCDNLYLCIITYAVQLTIF
ncbi:unnamed protein product [Soboliphyme baturini]|uniref:RNase_Zc3h12a domain-containing protein n=1 Tax=Soboliphyme baturini TaxID=241478 RepID=A0A183J1M1_9BILA|nr:unnamed protein product [Soboliphyme baturini]